MLKLQINSFVIRVHKHKKWVERSLQGEDNIQDKKMISYKENKKD